MALRGQTGATSYLIGMGSDVTLARELERLKSQFISMVSHELRTPLTSIRASMQLLIAEDMTGNEDADQLVRVALSNADRLIRIVNDILDMSKIEAGEMMVSPRKTRLAPIVEDSVRSVQAVARDAGVTITLATDDIDDVLADPDRTIQVLVNLLSNAVKHAPSGSKVEVSAGREGDMVAIAVRDHGPGIPFAQGRFHLRAVYAARWQRHAPHCRHRPRPDDRARAGGETGRRDSRLVARRPGRDVHADDAGCEH